MEKRKNEKGLEQEVPLDAPLYSSHESNQFDNLSTKNRVCGIEPHFNLFGIQSKCEDSGCSDYRTETTSSTSKFAHLLKK